MKLLNEILGTKYPIIQGGMANIATGEFAAACSNAGALGLIGSGGMDADALRENIRHCRALTDQPFGVNIMLMHPQADEFAKIVVEEGVKIVTTGAGNPGKYMAMWKAAGITVIPVVAAAILAKHLEPLGIDAVIAEGTESGGHVGEMTTMALVPQVVDAVHVPVIAAGGIADGRGLAAALALGACGVQVGTCLLASTECPIHENYKAALLKARDSDTIVTGRIGGTPVRVLKNRMSREYVRQGVNRICEKDGGKCYLVLSGGNCCTAAAVALHHERSLTMPQTESMRRAALVTGGAKGIGRAVCLALAENGMNIAVNYAGSAAAAEETAAACRAFGVQAITLQADVRSPEACQNLVEDTAAAFGRIDVLVNNAGITADKLLMRMTESDFDNVLFTNLKGTFFCTKAASRLMMRQRYGRIINISSVVGLHGNAGQANYAASKAGLIGLTKSVAKEYAARNITANAVAPGFIETDMTAAMPESARAAAAAAIPAGRIGRAEDVAAAVAFLAGEQAGYITGQVLCVDGGMGM